MGKVNEYETVIVLGTDRKILKFIEKEFLNPESVQMYNENINYLKELPIEILRNGVAKMKYMEEGNDNSKVLTPILAFIVVILSVYSDLVTFGITDEGWKVGVKAGVFIGFFIFIAGIHQRTKQLRNHAIYFKGILESLIEDK